MNHKTKKIKNIKKKLNAVIILSAILIIIVILIVLIGISIYIFNANNKFIGICEKMMPYPAVIIDNTNFITIHEFKNNLTSVKQFYEKQDFSKAGLRVDFTTADGQKRLKIREKELLNKMIEDRSIEILAKRKGVTVTAQVIDQNVQRKLDEYGTKENVEKKLKDLYSWTLDDFKQKVVRPSMYSDELKKLVENENKDEFSSASRKKIEKAQQELQNKIDFSEVAKNYSDGPAASQGGELGWLKKDQLIPEIANTVFSLGKNQRSDILESSLGFHIIEVEDKKTEKNEDLVKIRQIFTRKIMFADWLDKQIKSMTVYVPVKDYQWNKEKGVVDFESNEMKEFEKNILDNFQGDALIIF